VTGDSAVKTAYWRTKREDSAMRVIILAATAFIVTQTASAQPVAPEQISYSPEFQTALDEEYGLREGEILRRAVADSINNELARRGVSTAGGPAIEVLIVNAEPNRPTMQQLAEQPGLDSIRSISIGGADLRAVLRSADGTVVEEVEHRRFNYTIDEAVGSSTWTEARRSIRRFANKVADAYVAHASAR
jgi:hypothetical protein